MWAAIIAVPTLVTGFMGMNVPYPGFGQFQGFALAFVVMICAVVTLYVLFRRNDWLQPRPTQARQPKPAHPSPRTRAHAPEPTHPSPRHYDPSALTPGRSARPSGTP